MEFISAYYREREIPDAGDRIAGVLDEIAATGTYWQTPDELAYGAKMAWRQSVRCIGRVRWAGLKVRDRRTVTTAYGIAGELADHLRVADNDGRIQSVITVFAPDDPVAGPRARVWNDQLIRYCGWQLHDLVREVALTHPQHARFADLGLRWHALPVIANMRLRIGGVDYSCAPFNGHYLADEIGTRNMGDVQRYNQLGTVAEGLGLDTSEESALWREHAALVLNQAVLHSFRAAGVRISSPHAESELFMRFCAAEERAGRPVYGDWSWLNGSVGWAALHAVHHRYYDTRVPNPNFWPGVRTPYFPEPTLRERHYLANLQEG